jgi:hypothetical protein
MIPQRWCDWLAGSMTGVAIGAWFSVIFGPAPAYTVAMTTFAAVTAALGCLVRSRMPERHP